MEKEETYILHETQESALCGQHCLNNLVQQTTFGAVDLAELAQELDAQERSMMTTVMTHESGNVDESGNFSIEVLRCAVKRSYDIDLISWTGSEGRSHTEPSDEEGFIVNRSNHWFTIRKVGSRWWNLDSTLDKPEHISPFYLSAYLAQLRGDGFQIFIARGNVPKAGIYMYNPNDYVGAVWYPERALLGTTSATMPNPRFQQLRDDEEDEDLELAKAISASLM